MARPKKFGVNKTTKTLASGEKRTYYYHRATGVRVMSDYGTEEFKAEVARLDEMVAPVRNPKTIAGLIQSYTTSDAFLVDLRASTRTEYRRMLTALEERFGTMPIAALKAPRSRAVFLKYHKDIAADRPREADNRLAVLGSVFNHAIDFGFIEVNRVEGFRHAWKPGRRAELIWTEGDVLQFMKDAPLPLQRAMILALHTGQRYDDLVQMRWSVFDGEFISIIQSKTKRRVEIPCTAALKRMLNGMLTGRVRPLPDAHILRRANGQPWPTKRDNKRLSKEWRAHQRAAGVSEALHFHDLRGTAVTLLAESGCDNKEIAAITGHKLRSVETILETYLARTRVLAKTAIERFEASEATSFANQLQTNCKPAQK